MYINLGVKFLTDPVYEDKITTQWCVDRDSINYKNICDGSVEDCIAKGKAKCSADDSCYGIMFNKNNGVIACRSTKLETNFAQDWQTFFKSWKKIKGKNLNYI